MTRIQACTKENERQKKQTKEMLSAAQLEINNILFENSKLTIKTNELE